MDEVLLERDGHVASLVLNRPERMNTISQPMLTALSDALLACDDDPEIRCVVITGRGAGTLQEAADQHENISFVVADVTNPADVDRTLAAVHDRHGRLDVLVNNAGVAPSAPIDEIDAAHVDAIFGVNVRGLIDTSIKALPALRASKGTIINISSILSDRPLPSLTVYAASKAAVKISFQ